MNATPVPINIIQVYALTAESSDRDIEKFYGDLENTLKATKHHENIIIGDFNAKVGNVDGTVTGKYGLGDRN